MAEYIPETKITQWVYIRRYLPSGTGEKYYRQPYSLVRYDDGQEYVEPVDCGFGAYQWFDLYPDAGTSTMLIADTHPFAGVTEFR
jgi:hypothetical protein